jgi:hypothetical protein
MVSLIRIFCDYFAFWLASYTYLLYGRLVGVLRLEFGRNILPLLEREPISKDGDEQEHGSVIHITVKRNPRRFRALITSAKLQGPRLEPCLI